MDLGEFVKQSLTQIVAGVKDSQEEIRNLGAYVSPAMFAASPGNADATHFGSVGDVQNVFLIDFDVAVTVTGAVEGGVGGKLSVASFFKVDAGGRSSMASEATSRIKFKVPLALPVDPTTKKKLTDQIAAQERTARNATDHMEP